VTAIPVRTVGELTGDRCTAVSRSQDEELLGTASRARRWLLVEQAGPWGRDAIAESDLPGEIAAHLTHLAQTLPARVLLIRRTGGVGTPGTRRVVFAGTTDPAGGGWLEGIVLDHVRDLLDLDLGGLSSGDSVGGVRLFEPIYLVCTNGKHDACCATYGLPVARALSERLPERTWECSHVGGDRFAGNLVCLPEGVFYGHLDGHTALRAVAAHEAGRVVAEHCRGRSPWSFPVQAAELFARRELGIQRLDGLRYLAAERDGARHRVRFALRGGGEAVVTVAQGRAATARPLTCGSEAAHPPTHTLLDLEVTSVDDA
jgi:hypothetical protein